MGREVHKVGIQGVNVALANLETLLGQYHDAAPFRRFVGQRGELGSVGQFGLGHAIGWQEGRGLAIAERDRAGLVHEQHIDVAGRFDGAAGGGDDVCLHHAAHAGHANGRQQPGNGGRDQADEQRDEHRDADRRAGAGDFDAEHREGQQGDDDAEEDDGQRDEQDGQGDFIRRLLALGVFDHGDHAVDEGFARIYGHAHDNPVGQHAGTAGDGREVATGFTDDRSRFAGDGRFVHRGDTFDDFAVGRNGFLSLDDDDVALTQIGCLNHFPLGTEMRLMQLLGPGFLLEAAKRSGLRLAAAFGQRLGKIGEKHGEPQPDGNHQDETGRCFALATEGLQPQDGGQDAADVDDEHHRVTPLHGRIQFPEGIGDGRQGQRRIEQGKSLACHYFLRRLSERPRARGAR